MGGAGVTERGIHPYLGKRVVVERTGRDSHVVKSREASESRKEQEKSVRVCLTGQTRMAFSGMQSL